MKLKLSSPQRGESGLLDLFVMLIAVALVALLFLPVIAKRRARSSGIGCANNLKQIAVSVWMWSDDNGGRPPSHVPTKEGGAQELIEAGSVAGYFMVMSNELGTPKIVACPDDPAHMPAADFGTLRETNIGYFVVPEAGRAITNLWLSGDRHLATNRVPLKPGLFNMPTKGLVNWSDKLDINHRYLCYADGHVDNPSSTKLESSAINAVKAYREATTNTSFRLVIP